MGYVILHYVVLRRETYDGAGCFEQVFSRILLHTVRAGSHPAFERLSTSGITDAKVYMENSPVVF